MEKRLLVCGGREFSDRGYLENFLDTLQDGEGFTTLIHGAARGADRLAGMWAKSRGLKVIEVPAEWDRYGRAAGPIRNNEMLKHSPDLVVAFPGGAGTAHMTKLCLSKKLTVLIA